MISQIGFNGLHVNRKAEQVLPSFLGFEPSARCDLQKELVRRGVHIEQLTHHVPVFGELVHDGRKRVLSRDDGVLLLIRFGQTDHWMRVQQTSC